jgi:uncharacterized protein
MNVFIRIFALCAVFGIATSVVDIAATAADVAAPPAPRSEGEDLYRRGLYPEAIAWWTEQAAKGDAQAARRLGVEYMDGKGNVVERDYEKARKYHLQAAKAGEARSMMDLGTIYEQGLGVPADLIEAARWYEWSAKYGHGPAQYNIATMLETGEGGRKDEVEAYMYYLLAVENGMGGLPFDEKKKAFSSSGISPREALERRLTPAQRADGKARAKAFKPLSGPMPE